MNGLDIFLLIPTVYFIIRGIQRGLFRELFVVLGLILGLLISLKLAHSALDLITGSTTLDSPYLPLFVHLALFITVLIATNALGNALEKLLKVVKLNMFNRIAGALLGAFKGLIVVSLLFWLGEQSGLISEQSANDSLTYVHVKDFSPKVIGFIADLMPWFRDVFQDISAYFKTAVDGFDSSGR